MGEREITMDIRTDSAELQSEWLKIPRSFRKTGSFGSISPAKYKGEDVMVKKIGVGRNWSIKWEVAILRNLNCCFILHYYGIVRDHRCKYVVMEKCEGSLDEYMEGKLSNIPLIDEKHLLAQLTSGLSYIHGEEILHKNLQPSNVLLWKSSTTKDVLVKITGFVTNPGLHKRIQRGQHSNNPRATEFIAPELLEQVASIKPTIKSDIFSLGAVFFYVLSKGQYPFSKETLVQNNRIRSRGANLKAICDRWDALNLISRMIHRDPQKRPNTSLILLHPFFSDCTDETRRYFAITLYYLEEMASEREPLLLQDCFKRNRLEEWFEMVKSEEKDSLTKTVGENVQPEPGFLGANFGKDVVAYETLKERYEKGLYQIFRKNPCWHVINVLRHLQLFPTTFIYQLWCSLLERQLAKTDGKQRDTGNKQIITTMVDLIYGVVYGCSSALDYGMTRLSSMTMDITEMGHLVNLASITSCTQIINEMTNAGIRFPSSCRYWDRTAHFAAAFSTSQFLRLLLDKGISVHIPDRDTIFPIQLAAAFSDVEKVELMLEKGAPLNPVSKGGWTILHDVALNSSPEMMNFFVSKGMHVNMKSDNQCSILYSAAQNSIEMVELLLKKGMDLYERDRYGRTILHSAVRNSFPEMVQFLLEKGLSKNVKTWNGTNILHSAVENSIEMVQFLLNRGMDLTVTSKNGSSVLHYAARSSSTQMMQFLLKKGMDLNIRDKKGALVIHSAAENYPQMVDYLLSNGMDLYETDENGRTILHYTAFSRTPLVMVDFLLNKGMDLNVKDKFGLTVLHCAVEHSSTQLVDFLLQKGMQLYTGLPGSNDTNILFYAAKNRNQAMFRHIQQLLNNPRC